MDWGRDKRLPSHSRFLPLTFPPTNESLPGKDSRFVPFTTVIFNFTPNPNQRV